MQCKQYMQGTSACKARRASARQGLRMQVYVNLVHARKQSTCKEGENKVKRVHLRQEHSIDLRER